MENPVSSVLVGTIGLSALLLISLGLGVSRPPIASSALRRVRVFAAVNLLGQLAHFAEEYASGFPDRFPRLLGLAPWSENFFVAFNAAWIAIWILAIAMLARYQRAASIPLWFLALASVLNAIAHPLLSIAVRGYFPGLYSSLVVGVFGALLTTALLRATARSPGSRSD